MIDAHAHLEMLENANEALKRAREAGLKLIVAIADALKGFSEVVRIAEAYDEVVFGIGIHPHDASRWNKDVERIIRETLHHKKAVLVGETGLDFYRMRSPKDIQIDVFRKQLEIASEYDVPVAVHIRDAYQKAYEVIKEYPELSGKIILHCFSSDKDDVLRFVEIGCYISYAGPVTYPKSDRLREAALVTPVDRILVETDCPYLSPQPVRGRENEPANVVYVIGELAKIKKIESDVLSEKLYLNLLKVLGISPVRDKKTH